MEDFVTLEIAKKLKKKGFDWDALDVYDKGLFYWLDEDVPRPTISQALKWLRVEKQIDIYVTPNWHDKDQKYYAACIVKDRDYNHGGNIEPNDFQYYEQAALAGVNYCLENLI